MESENMTTMTEQISRQTSSIITRYFQLLLQRNFTEAERELERIKQGIKPILWCKGYYNALEGMITALRSGENSDLYISRAATNDSTKIDESQKRFTRLSKDPLQGEFDKGYFTAWIEYLQALRSRKIDVKSLNGYLPP